MGISGYVYGVKWVVQREEDVIGIGAKFALVGSVLSLVSVISSIIINLKE